MEVKKRKNKRVYTLYKYIKSSIEHLGQMKLYFYILQYLLINN